MPQYLMLIYRDADAPPPAEMPPEVHERWGAYTQSLKDAGLHIAGDALQDVDTATTVRESDGELQIIDGPFAETKEILGGYYLVESPDLDTVLEHAKNAPNVSWGSIEVRPILEFHE
jgi:hypothetical protein